ncbi:endonuclease/exonuclease/phosphatase family protein [Persicobacter diffluens]|uniref:Endonuclease n=1 Tax=Persicobacter diffluens TaxID=981 RepID=A0AAN4W458_9BACT|nr:endonuclease [Persicobacter diffluens]
MISTICISGLIISMVITTLQLLRRDHWIIRMSDFPHAQLTVMTVVCLVGLLFFSDLGSPWYIMALEISAGLNLAYQFYIIFPYTRLSPKQVKTIENQNHTTAISILESNVYMDNDQYDKLIALVYQYQPDILITLETDQKWQNKLSILESEYPYSVKCPSDNTYGMHLYSKRKLVNQQVHYLIEQDVPSIEAELLMENQQKVRLHILHPKPPSPTQNKTSTPRDAELILIAKQIVNLKLPVIVAGDLNDVAWSHTNRLFQRISGLLDPRIGRGFFNTFHAKYPFMRWPLDHIFHSNHFLVSSIQRLPNIGSDHFPMFIQLQYSPSRAAKKNDSNLSASLEDHQEAKKKLNKVNIRT